MPNSGADTMTLNAATQTLTNKTLTSPKINEDVVLTSTASELNLLDGVSGLVQADFTKLAAIDASAAELNYNDITTLGTVEPSKTVTADSSGNVTFPDNERLILGNTTAGSLQIYHQPLTSNSGITFMTSDSNFRIEGEGVSLSNGTGFGNITTTDDGMSIGGPLRNSGTLELKGGGFPAGRIQFQSYSSSSTYDGLVYADFTMMPTFTSGGTTYNGSLDIKNPQQDHAISFSGNDGGTSINNALTIDFANSGRVILRSDLALHGSTDDSNLTTITCVDPTANRTITFPDETGKVNLSPAKKKFIRQQDFISRNVGALYKYVNPAQGYYYGQTTWTANRAYLHPWIINGDDDHSTVTIDEVAIRSGFNQSNYPGGTCLIGLFALNEYGVPDTLLYETTITVPANMSNSATISSSGLTWSVKPGVYACVARLDTSGTFAFNYVATTAASFYSNYFEMSNGGTRPANRYSTINSTGTLLDSTSPYSYSSSIGSNYQTIFNYISGNAPMVWWRYDTDL